MTNDEWLKEQCNRHTNGMCQTRSCLIRGGYDGIGPVNYTKATCEAHEILAELEALRSKGHAIENLRSSLHAAHGLLAPLGNQPIPSLIAIREALRILKGAL